MFRTLRDAPLAVGFLSWRFMPREDSLVLVVKGTYALAHGGRAVAVDPEPVLGDVFAGDDALAGACLHASELVPFKPKADALLVGKVYTPEGKPLPRCSASFSVGGAALSLLVTGDRYWLHPPSPQTSEPRPFSAMDIGYARAFGGPGWAANPAGRGVFAADAHDAIDRPLPNVEDPRDLVQKPGDRPAPAGFGPLSPHAAHRMATWPRALGSYAEERWPWPPEGLDHRYFNAAQPALQIEGYLRGDEAITCENLHPKHRRFTCELPRERARCFVVEGDRFREIALRLDTISVDMEAGKLALVWRGSLVVASDTFDEVSHVYVTTEPLDGPRASVEAHRMRLEVLRLEADAKTVAAPPAPAGNDNDAPKAAAPPMPKPPAPPKPLVTAAERAMLERKGAPAAVLEALDRGDAEGAQTAAAAASGQSAEVFERSLGDAREKLRAALAAAGEDASLVDARPPKLPKPRVAPKGPPAPWTRERVEACLMSGVPIGDADLGGLDLSKLDFSTRDLTGCLLTGARLGEARFDEAILVGANLADVDAQKASLRDARLDEADLTGANLAAADLTGAHLGGAVLDHAVLRGAHLDGVDAARAYVRHADLTGATLTKAKLVAARFDGATLDGASLRDADLTRASAQGVHAEGADLRGATLTRFVASEGSRFARVKLAGCRADRSIWSGADLKGADLTRCDLRRAELSSADLSGAKLSGADASEADLTSAKLTGAALDGANLRAGRLEQADLRRANLRNASLYQANVWRAQIEGLDRSGAFTAGTLFESPARGWAR
ncbi:MAG TPA: DUF2169 domain-containing protein [Byssovorax sp.]|jgi:uncharacterized protein YjbI with pentapeptide repeats